MIISRRLQPPFILSYLIVYDVPFCCKVHRGPRGPPSHCFIQMMGGPPWALIDPGCIGIAVPCHDASRDTRPLRSMRATYDTPHTIGMDQSEWGLYVPYSKKIHRDHLGSRI